jgi:hypothetical protein
VGVFPAVDVLTGDREPEAHLKIFSADWRLAGLHAAVNFTATTKQPLLCDGFLGA